MTEPDEVLDPAALLLLLDEQESLEDALNRLVATCRDAIPACTDASVTMQRPQRPTTAAATSENALRIDRWEYDTGRGPCMDALRDGREHYVDSLADAGRYEGFAQVLEQSGVRSAYGVPLIVGEEIVGALNVYAAAEHAFDDDTSRAVARHVAAQAARTLHNLRVYDASRTLARQLEQALESRAIIEQAKGVLMAQRDCSTEEAFEMLKRASQRENVKLRDVAQRIVSSVSAG
ncbi:MAG TPA: GAF and ANTAR domain-containing protein [Mycobacteriales bacterium]|jgi:GAF domain-containing protein